MFAIVRHSLVPVEEVVEILPVLQDRRVNRLFWMSLCMENSVEGVD